MPRSLFTFLWTSSSSRSIKTQKENSANIQPSWPRAWSIIYTWQAPRAGSMRRILCSYWLPERARWSDTARPGLPVSFPQIKFCPSSSECTRVFFIFCQGKKMFCVFSVFMEPEKASTRMKTKKTKMLMSFKSTFCDKNRQTQKFVFKIWIWIWNLNLKCNQSNDCIFCIYPITI